MSKILEMRQKRAEVWDKARAFLDEHTNENGVMSAEDSQQYERMEQEVVDLGHTIDRMERAEQMEREMNEPVRQLPFATSEEQIAAVVGNIVDGSRSVPVGKALEHSGCQVVLMDE